MAKTKKIKLDKVRTMKYPVYSLVRLQEEQGVRISDLQDGDKAQDMRVILSLIWAGLIHEDPDLTVEHVGNNMDIADLPEIAKSMGEIFESMNAKSGK